MVKKANKPTSEVEVNVDAIESKRLESLAFDQGVLSKTRGVATTVHPPTNLMLKADGKDITKRSSARRNRYLLVFNCQLAPAAAGRLGTLARLDTKNPVMYLEFPEGRLRLRGTLMFPKNKYVVLRLGNKEALCEDVMESIIVFSEYHWVGTAEENPEEVELPMPESLKTERRHAAVDFGGRGNTAAGTVATTEIDYEATQEEDVGDALPASQPSQPPSQQRRTSRQTRGKRQRYLEDSDASLGEDDDDADEMEGIQMERKLPRAPSAARKPNAGKAGQQRRQSLNQSQSQSVINLVDEGSEEEEEGDTRPTAGATKQAKLSKYFKGSGSKGAIADTAPPAKRAKKAKPPKIESIEDEDLINLASSSDEEGDDLPLSQRPRRAAGVAAKKSLSSAKDSDEEDRSDSESSEEGSEPASDNDFEESDSEGDSEGNSE